MRPTKEACRLAVQMMNAPGAPVIVDKTQKRKLTAALALAIDQSGNKRKRRR